MTCRVLSVDELDAAVELLSLGAVVAVPTDTVYGLAAWLADDDAVARLALLKHRPASVPIAVLCATVQDAKELAAAWPAGAVVLADRFWPGALTIVVPVERALARRVGAERGVGLRVPADDTCRALLARTGPLAVTSANLHGEAPVSTALGVQRAFRDEQLTAVLDDGPRTGTVSTVVDLAGDPPAVLREGAIATIDVLAALRGA
jgi:tRNA threonylcarbamoyl adenosine modification protein (Sua5/YciO/YrdC/YwlC family)